MRSLKLASALLALSVFTAPVARAASEQSDLVDHARIVIDDLKRDKEFGTATSLMHRAKGVLIVPSLIKGGFFFGGEGGTGVLLTKNQGHWSYPAFYTLASASFGLQIGLEQAELILFIMSDKALNAVEQDEFKLGAQAGVAVVTLGSTAEADTADNLSGDIIVWASSSGAYAGITLNGSIIKPHNDWNTAYYGRPEGVQDILTHGGVMNPDADRLRSDLASVQ